MGILEIENYFFDDFESQSRIRSKRRKRREVIEARDKKLTKETRDLPMIDLKPPIQRGWKRYFIVREDVRRSKQGVFYENLLQKINTFQYSPTKEFKTKKKKMGRRIYVEKEQKLRLIYPSELKKMKFTEAELACFTLKTKTEIKGKRFYETTFYEMNEPWRYVLRIRPNMIDKTQVHDDELEQKLAELRDLVYENKLNFSRLKKIKGWHWNHWKVDEKYPNPFKNMPLQQIIEDF